MELKNIPILEEKLFILTKKVDEHLTNKTKRNDDMEFMFQMIENHADDLALVKLALKKSEGEIQESDFKDVLIHVNQFADKALKLLK